MLTNLPVATISIPNPYFEGQNSVYVVMDDPITLIDSGIATEDAFAALQSGLQQHHLTVCDIQRVVLTHKHVDHMGNAWRIQQASGATILIHATETEAVYDVPATQAQFLSQVASRAKAWGVPRELQSTVHRMRLPHWQMQSAACVGLEDGEVIPFEHGSLHVLHTPGHTRGSICLRSPHGLFTGDHVLPDISPNIGAGELERRGMLSLYLQSLDKVSALGDPLDLYPGHGDPFRHLRQRCAALLQHHESRLRDILQILRQGPLSIFEIAMALFGSLTDFHIFLGCAEANAHVELLEERGHVCPMAGGYGLA